MGGKKIRDGCCLTSSLVASWLLEMEEVAVRSAVLCCAAFRGAGRLRLSA